MPDTSVRARSGILQGSKIIGCRVENPQGENLGKIEDVMIDLNEGFVAAAVLSFGGFLGMGNKLFAVPLSALQFDSVDKKFLLNMDKETLKNAPGFDKDNWPNMNDRLWAADVYSYYGFPPYWQ